MNAMQSTQAAHTTYETLMRLHKLATDAAERLGEKRTPRHAQDAIEKDAIFSRALDAALSPELVTALAALHFIADLSEEELPYATVGTGGEVTLRHVARRARAAIARAEVELRRAAAVQRMNGQPCISCGERLMQCRCDDAGAEG